MNGCVVYLARADFSVNAGGFRVKDASFSKCDHTLSMKMLFENYVNYYPCDVIVFHESDFPEDYMSYVHSTISDKVKFRELNFSIPPHLNTTDIPTKFISETTPSFGFSLGYRHMCRFFSGEIFSHLSGDYDYYMRLDTDSFITEKVSFNFFEQMKDLVYGYYSTFTDNPGVVCNFKDALQKYDDKFSDSDGLTSFATNWEVCDINWFRNSEYWDYYQYIDSLGGIYQHRWGDAPIRYAGVSAYANDKIKQFRFSYHHGPSNRLP